MTLSEFLLARIAEDEAAAKACGYWPGILDPFAGDSAEFKTQVLRWNPARVLAECEAKRQLVADHNAEVAIEDDGQEFWTDCESCRQSPPCTTLRILGTVFADHPDYDEAWRP